MQRLFYKSLDQPFEIFGLKGRWVRVFLFLLGGCIALAFMVGAVAGSGYGISAAIIGAVCSFIGCFSIQGRIPERRLMKNTLVMKMDGWIRRRETLKSILTPIEDKQ